MNSTSCDTIGLLSEFHSVQTDRCKFVLTAVVSPRGHSGNYMIPQRTCEECKPDALMAADCDDEWQRSQWRHGRMFCLSIVHGHHRIVSHVAADYNATKILSSPGRRSSPPTSNCDEESMDLYLHSPCTPYIVQQSVSETILIVRYAVYVTFITTERRTMHLWLWKRYVGYTTNCDVPSLFTLHELNLRMPHLRYRHQSAYKLPENYIIYVTVKPAYNRRETT